MLCILIQIPTKISYNNHIFVEFKRLDFFPSHHNTFYAFLLQFAKLGNCLKRFYVVSKLSIVIITQILKNKIFVFP